MPGFRMFPAVFEGCQGPCTARKCPGLLWTFEQLQNFYRVQGGAPSPRQFHTPAARSKCLERDVTHNCTLPSHSLSHQGIPNRSLKILAEIRHLRFADFI
jgi:hypothetical protein